MSTLKSRDLQRPIKVDEPTLRGDPINGERYTSPEFFDAEWNRMWMRTWQIGGLLSEAPEPGDYKNAELGKESILLVHQDGGIVHMVDEDKRAWHAGKSSWEGAGDVNSRSVGIEVCNPGHGDDYHDFPDAQIEAVIALSNDIVARHAIQPRHVLAHSDVAPGRKIDPGEKFPWARLAERGIGLWVTPAAIADGPVLDQGASGAQVAELQQNLAAYGYGIDITGDYDAATATVVQAFQLHFRPQLCDGRADVSTIATLEALLAAHSA